MNGHASIRTSSSGWADVAGISTDALWHGKLRAVARRIGASSISHVVHPTRDEILLVAMMPEGGAVVVSLLGGALDEPPDRIVAEFEKRGTIVREAPVVTA